MPSPGEKEVLSLGEEEVPPQAAELVASLVAEWELSPPEAQEYLVASLVSQEQYLEALQHISPVPNANS